MNLKAAYPTPEHERAADAVVHFFASLPEAEAVLLVNSCARGQATTDSCLDVAVLVTPEALASHQKELETLWQEFFASDAAFARLRRVGRFSVVHFDYFDGGFVPTTWDDGGGPDAFELELGNRLAYSVPLWERKDRLARLKAEWLPYYGKELRQQRLAMVQSACLEDLDHIAGYVERGLYFAAFDRLYTALQEFLQALFISRKVYPIAYNKWIRQQVVELLGLPNLYKRLPPLLQVSRLESDELVGKAEALRALVLELK